MRPCRAITAHLSASSSGSTDRDSGVGRPLPSAPSRRPALTRLPVSRSCCFSLSRPGFVPSLEWHVHGWRRLRNEHKSPLTSCVTRIVSRLVAYLPSVARWGSYTGPGTPLDRTQVHYLLQDPRSRLVFSWSRRTAFVVVARHALAHLFGTTRFRAVRSFDDGLSVYRRYRSMSPPAALMILPALACLVLLARASEERGAWVTQLPMAGVGARAVF